MTFVVLIALDQVNVGGDIVRAELPHHPGRRRVRAGARLRPRRQGLGRGAHRALVAAREEGADPLERSCRAERRRRQTAAPRRSPIRATIRPGWANHEKNDLITAVWPGQPYPRGASWDGEGVNFALFSQHAEKVELCLFDETGRHERQRIVLRERTDTGLALLPARGAPGPGLRLPRARARTSPSRAIASIRTSCWSTPTRKRPRRPAALGRRAVRLHRRQQARGPLLRPARQRAAACPSAASLEPAFTWGDDRRPAVPWQDMVIYELHVRGFTMTHPEVPENLRGTYAALGSAPVVDYLKRLGVTTIELLPVHAFLNDRHLVDKGLRNYWGYNTLGYFAPELRYSASRQGEGIQDHGEGAAQRRHRGPARRGLQPHLRRQPARPDPLAARPRQRRLLHPQPRERRATTTTSPAAATPSTSSTRARCSW